MGQKKIEKMEKCGIDFEMNEETQLTTVEEKEENKGM